MLDLKTFLIKEHIAFVKLTDAFDIVDPNTAEKVGEAKEEPEPLFKYLRLVLGKNLLPTRVVVNGGSTGALQFELYKPFSLFRSYVDVLAPGGRKIGTLASKILTIGGGFKVYDTTEREIAEVSGDWKGWNFTVKDATGRQWGSIGRKWGGIGKELLTSADNYVVDASGAASRDERALVLAAGLAIDIVYKEGK